MPDVKNQLSFTAVLADVERHGGSDTGLGDFALNYRYQLLGDGNAPVAIAPRLSIFFPTGSYCARPSARARSAFRSACR